MATVQAAWPLGPPLGQQQVKLPQAFCVGTGLPVSHCPRRQL
jgi:hypothetical protein